QKLVTMLPDRLRDLPRDMSREELHQYRALRRLPVRDVGGDDSGRDQDGQRGGNERKPPPLPEGDEVEPAEPQDGRAARQRKSRRRSDPQADRAAGDAPQDDPDRFLPIARRRQRGGAVESHPQQLTYDQSVKGNAGDVLVGLSAPGQRRIEIVRDALRRHTDQDRLVTDGGRVDGAGQHVRQRDGAERPSRALEVEEKLITVCVGADVAPVVAFEGPDARPTELESLRVPLVGLSRHALDWKSTRLNSG